MLTRRSFLSKAGDLCSAGGTVYMAASVDYWTQLWTASRSPTDHDEGFPVSLGRGSVWMTGTTGDNNPFGLITAEEIRAKIAESKGK